MKRQRWRTGATGPDQGRRYALEEGGEVGEDLGGFGEAAGAGGAFGHAAFFGADEAVAVAA